MKKNCDIYQKTIKTNIFEIKTILENLGMKKEIPLSLYENFLNQSANMVTSKWLSERKYCRTHFAQKALGKLYPDEYIQISLCIDAMINILDDLLDEQLNEQAKTEYILEFLRVFSIYNSKCPSKKIQKFLEKYFNKLITLAIAENFYQQKIIQEQNMSKIVKNSADLLLCRGMDIDIFIEISLLKLKNQKAVPIIKEMSKIFRAINILKKDIKDISHDRENNIETVVILVLSKDKTNFSIYINNLLNLFSEKTNLIMKPINKLDKIPLHLLPIYNFNEMIQKEKRDILKIVQAL